MVTGGPGSGATTLALALLAAPSTHGSWCAIVGLADPGVVAMAELGIELGRLALVPRPRGGWVDAVGELSGGVDVLLVRPPGPCRPALARRLAARSRERQTALVVLVDKVEEWPEAPDLTLRVTMAVWHGLGAGHGHLQRRLADVEALGRRSAARTVLRRLWLPSGAGNVTEAVEPAAGVTSSDGIFCGELV